MTAMNFYFATLILIILSLTTLQSPAQSVDLQQSNPETKNSDYFIKTAMNCHYKYAQSYYLSSATASEIAQGAIFECANDIRNLEESAYIEAVADGLPNSTAIETQKKVAIKFTEFAKSFTVNLVIKLRTKNKQ